jgi:hypothetical protein
MLFRSTRAVALGILVDVALLGVPAVVLDSPVAVGKLPFRRDFVAAVADHRFSDVD